MLIVGSDITSVFTPTVDGKAVSPASVTVGVRQGHEAETDLSGSIVNIGGAYKLTWTATHPGRHRVTWRTSGPAVVEWSEIHVSSETADE